MSLPIYLQPHDRSLQAFREWLEGKYRFHPSSKKTVLTKPLFSEKEWTENWKLYWAKVDGSTPKRD
jgi:hypothetical protein